MSFAAIVGCGGSGGEPTSTGPGLVIISGGSGSDTVGVELPQPLVVEVRGEDSRPAANVEVIFRAFRVGTDSTARLPLYLRKIPQGVADLTIRDTTDASGRASVTVVLGTPAGEGKVIASAPAFSVSKTALFTTRPGTPDAMVIAPADTPVVVGRVYDLTASLVDRFQNPVAGTPTFSRITGPVQVSTTGTVHGSAVGRAAISVRIGAFQDTAFVSVVPQGTLAIRDYGRFAGDTLGFAQVSLDGSNYRWIARTGITPSEYGPSNQLAPQWIPGTGQLVYVQLVGESERLFVGDSTGTTRRLIDSASPVRSESDHDVSPDGAWVYFVGRDSSGAQAIWRVAVSGGTPERLTTTADGYEFRSPSVSPDGGRLVYVASTASWDNFRPYIRDLSTGATMQLSTNEAAGTVWSPNSDWILYAVSGPYAGYSGRLHVIYANGGGDRALGEAAYYPGGTWSPDGKYVIAVRAGPEPYGPELIDVAAGMHMPLAYKRAWYAPRWRR